MLTFENLDRNGWVRAEIEPKEKTRAFLEKVMKLQPIHERFKIRTLKTNEQIMLMYDCSKVNTTWNEDGSINLEIDGKHKKTFKNRDEWKEFIKLETNFYCNESLTTITGNPKQIERFANLMADKFDDNLEPEPIETPWDSLF